MRKKVLYIIQCVLVKSLLFGVVYPFQAQVSNPLSWERFVDSDENRLVSDTFRLQTFGDSEWDNWEYSLSGTTKILDVSSVNTDKLGGIMGLKMSLGSKISFMQYNPALYTAVKAELFFGGNYLNKNENLNIQICRESATTTHTLMAIKENGTSIIYDSIAINNTPIGIDVYSETSSNERGYYCLKYALAYGNIPSYSLFTGMGNWNDTTRWSHLPPSRHRNALIKGEVNITDDMYCQDVAIHSGSLRISPANQLVVRNLDLYEDEAFLQSEGTIALSGRITFHKTFEEPGKWYFISFPFDVYPSDVDSRFEQKDATPNEGGNYFYLQSYNGDKRASSNQSVGNWEVVPVGSDDRPLFEKNRGYLIALDEKATKQTVSFSSRPGDISDDFAHAGVISIPLSVPMASGDKENYGWYLCGNPFPAPLPLSRIERNKALDGNIYVYDGSTYKTYPLNGNYALPPFSAFFVKASSPTVLNVLSGGVSTKGMSLIRTTCSLNKGMAEPHSGGHSMGVECLHAEDLLFGVKGGQLYLQNLPEAGSIKLFDMAGHCVFQKSMRQGTQVISVVSLHGLHIVQIHSGDYRQRIKIVLP